MHSLLLGCPSILGLCHVWGTPVCGGTIPTQRIPRYMRIPYSTVGNQHVLGYPLFGTSTCEFPPSTCEIHTVHANSPTCECPSDCMQFRSRFGPRMAGADTRTRFDAKHPESRMELLRVLEKHITIPTKIKYGTDATKSKVEKSALILHGALLVELRALQCNLSFSKAAMKDQLKELAEKKNDLVATVCS